MKTVALNVWMGLIAALLTFVTAFSQNLFTVALWRAAKAFVVFFALTFLLRWGLKHLLQKAEPSQTSSGASSETGPSAASPSLDGREGASPAALTNDPAEAFTPLVPPRIERTEAPVDPQDVLHAIRRLTDE